MFSHLVIWHFVLQSSWVSDEEFGMGHMESKPAASPAKAPPGYLSGFSWFFLVPYKLLWSNVGMRYHQATTGAVVPLTL